MHYLTAPVASFKALAKRPRVSDAIFIVASVWIVLLGLQLARLAALDSLTFGLALRSLIDITFGVVAVWVASAGLGYLLVHAAGGKGEFNSMLVMAGLAATPLALMGIAAIAIDLVGAAASFSDYAIILTTRILLWAGLILGTPGLYYTFGLHALGKVRWLTAALISAFLTLCVILIVLLQSNDILQV